MSADRSVSERAAVQPDSPSDQHVGSSDQQVGSLQPDGVPFLDLRVPAEEGSRLLAAIDRVFRHGRLVDGPEVREFESQVAERTRRQFAIGVGSGSDALYLALRALDLVAGDEVITTAMSWIATANAIALTGARPVFADVGDDFQLDPDSVARLVTPRTRAILVVHYHGHMADLGRLGDIAERHGLPLIEDAAQAFGAIDAVGRVAGESGLISCFSMNPMKGLAACGEAGLVLTNDAEIASRVDSLRYNGVLASNNNSGRAGPREVCLEPSINARLDTVQAAILLERLKTIDASISHRREAAALYDGELRDVDEVLSLPSESDGAQPVYYTYTVRVTRRDGLRAHLAACGIETKIRHPHLMPEQPAYREHAKGEWGHARKLLETCVSLPIHDKISPDAVRAVTSTIDQFFREDPS